MIKRLTIANVILLILAMCGSPKSNENLAESITTFTSDYDTLQKLALPLTLDYERWNEMAEKHYDKFGVKGGYNLLTLPFGKLIDAEGYKGIIFIYDDPILMTVDKLSYPLDTLFLLGDYSSNDPTIHTIEHAQVNSDLTIQLLDSIFTYDLGKDGERIESSKELTIQVKNYRIEMTGQIKKTGEFEDPPKADITVMAFLIYKNGQVSTADIINGDDVVLWNVIARGSEAESSEDTKVILRGHGSDIDILIRNGDAVAIHKEDVDINGQLELIVHQTGCETIEIILSKRGRKFYATQIQFGCGE